MTKRTRVDLRIEMPRVAWEVALRSATVDGWIELPAGMYRVRGADVIAEEDDDER